MVEHVGLDRATRQKLTSDLRTGARPIKPNVLGSSEVQLNFQRLVLISRLQSRGTGHPLDWVEQDGSGRTKLVSTSVQILKLLM